MSIDIAMAAVAVADMDEAEEFYTRLLGRPLDFQPMPTLAQWNFGSSGGVQVVGAPELAGKSLLTLLVSDFDTVLAELMERGIARGEVVTGTVSRLTEITDPAGNTITVAEIPS